MMLTLREACARLDWTPRQLRYRLNRGEVRGQKIEGRWRIDEADLPVDSQRAQADAARAADLRQTVDEALDQRRARRRYSVEDIRAFTDLTAVGREVSARLGVDHPAFAAIVSAASAVTHGVHAWGSRAKSEAFRQARRDVSSAIAQLHLRPGPDLEALDFARRLEDRVVPAIGGLIRRQSRRSEA